MPLASPGGSTFLPHRLNGGFVIVQPFCLMQAVCTAMLWAFMRQLAELGTQLSWPVQDVIVHPQEVEDCYLAALTGRGEDPTVGAAALSVSSQHPSVKQV